MMMYTEFSLMNVKKLRLGLIGKDVSKSQSQKIHTFILSQKGVKCEYENVSVSPRDFDAAMRRLTGDFDGFNVTIPYKEQVIPHLFWMSEQAKAIGAVNTIVNKNGKLYGYNTDFYGLKALIERENVTLKNIVFKNGNSP